MKNMIVGALFALLATFGVVAESYARDFICTGRTHYGDVVQVYGSFWDNGEVSEVYVDRNGSTWFYWDSWNVGWTATNTYWTFNALEDGMSLIIRHPERTSDRTYMRIYLDYDFDHEFNRASCKFYN